MPCPFLIGLGWHGGLGWVSVFFTKLSRFWLVPGLRLHIPLFRSALQDGCKTAAIAPHPSPGASNFFFLRESYRDTCHSCDWSLYAACFLLSHRYRKRARKVTRTVEGTRITSVLGKGFFYKFLLQLFTSCLQFVILGVYLGFGSLCFVYLFPGMFCRERPALESGLVLSV